jgi:hypothetical protein
MISMTTTSQKLEIYLHVNMLNHGGSVAAVNEAFDAVLNHPDSTWSSEVLNYRQRQVHYK